MSGKLRLLLPGVLMVLLALASVQNVFAAVELSYDDGVPDASTSVPAPYWFAVMFVKGESNWPAGWSTVRVLKARFYINAANPEPVNNDVKIHVMDSGKNDIITPPLTLTHPTAFGWWEVDLSSYNAIVSGAQFYIAWEVFSGVRWSPALDTTVIAGRSYDGQDPGTWGAPKTPRNYMIRALIEPIGAVGGIVLPINTLTVLAPYLAMIGLVATAAVAVKKRRH